MAVQITPLKGLEADYRPVDWDFAVAQKAEIAAHWSKLVAEKPRMFNGTVLLQHGWSLIDGVYRTGYTPVDYASFIAWIHFGQPGSPRRNGFAMAALQAADGPFVLGVMGAHTANAGKVYFPGGTPDMTDVTADGKVDLSGSVWRELAEETGLGADEVVISQPWLLAVDAYRAALLRPARLIYDATMAQRILRERIAAQADRELADIVIVASPEEIDLERTPAFAVAYMRQVFAGDHFCAVSS